jgi:hypothetical protein
VKHYKRTSTRNGPPFLSPRHACGRLSCIHYSITLERHGKMHMCIDRESWRFIRTARARWIGGKGLRELRPWRAPASRARRCSRTPRTGRREGELRHPGTNRPSSAIRGDSIREEQVSLHGRKGGDEKIPSVVAAGVGGSVGVELRKRNDCDQDGDFVCRSAGSASRSSEPRASRAEPRALFSVIF